MSSMNRESGLTQGRGFDQHDRRGHRWSAIINRAMAETFWPGQDPIGKRVAPGASTN